MPPKKGRRAVAPAAPALPALDTCKIALSGTFPAFSQAALKTKVEALGGTVGSTVTADTTQLIASDGDYAKSSMKVAKAKSLSIPVVSLRWLQLCEETGVRPAEALYEPGVDKEDDGNAQPVASQSMQIRADGPAQKRAASPAANSAVDDSEPKPKRARGRKATKVADNEVKDEVKDKGEEEDAHVPAAKSVPAKPAHAKTRPEPVMGEGQVTKRRDIQIPLDEGCPFASSIVYIAPDGVIFDASLNQTNASNNNNKFYRIQLLVDSSGAHRTWTRWGRVGERGQTAILGGGSLDDAIRQFEKKFKDKSGLAWNQRGENPKPGKYAFVERNYSVDSDDDEGAEISKKKPNGWVPPKSTLHNEVQKLMGLIFNQQFFAATMSALNYDANKLPLGKLSKAAITRGFAALKDLSALIDDQALALNYGVPHHEAIENLSNSYYSLIPHAFGRNRPPIISVQQMVKQEIELLDSLSDMKDAALIMKMDKIGDDDIHPLDKQYQGLGMDEMTPLDHTSTEFTHLTEYLTKTRGATHNANYKVESIFRIERQGEKDRFDSNFGKKAKNRRLLWHGSRAANFGGILSQGLRIAPPEAPVSGYMFGKGIYLADMSSKSANYCCSYLSDNTALLLLCEAELGDPIQELTDASYSAGEDAKEKGMISTWGKGSTGPRKWKDAECVHTSLKGIKMPDTSVDAGDTNVPDAYLCYNEYICYDVSQVRLRYLFRVKM
ncbi:poly polymerase catalytic domain-containing protein [Lasiosphaeris hirsuta]|uniref:Poly [ADP-ribose] polymerase n=1 Tax=Lasiosphaeris hirsuta TaxID=260670 RepID=A0AA40B144_9PEZI|nr:poly polymerase catalytic domain-containing protein [Lasiosphaeris hirsuta]